MKIIGSIFNRQKSFKGLENSLIQDKQVHQKNLKVKLANKFGH